MSWLASGLRGGCLCLAVFACGCDDDAGRRDCSAPYGASDAVGRWTISADGERKNCDDPALDGDLTLEFTMPVQVVATPIGGDGSDDDPDGFPDEDAGLDEDAGVGPVVGAPSEADAFVDRIVSGGESRTEAGPDHLLHAMGLDEATFWGQTEDACVDFTLQEPLAGGGEHRMDFTGSLQRRGRIEGAFSGYSRGGCQLSGDFTVTVD